MASSIVTAGDIMDLSAAALNDSDRSIYTYDAQLPYLKMALMELREFYELHSISVTESTSDEIEVPSGTTEIGFDTNPALPSDLVEIKQLWERNHGIDPYLPVDKRSFIPHNLQGLETSRFGIWAWESNKIKLLSSNQDNDIKMDYIKQLFNNITSEASQINVINASTFLFNRTAALCAELIGQNDSRATKLNISADIGLSRATGIAVKGKQSILTRRQPFRVNYKNRGNVI